MTITSELKGSTFTLYSSANTANTASITIDTSKIVTIGGTNTYFPPVENDLICTITPRTSGTNLAPIVEINSSGVYGYQFSRTGIKEVSFMVQLSHQWEEGSSVKPHLHWCPSNTNTANVIINMDYWVANLNEVIPSVTTISVTTTPNGTAFKHQISYLPTVSMTGKTASCIFGGRLYRDASTTGDDFTGDAIILGIDIHVKNNRWGYDV